MVQTLALELFRTVLYFLHECHSEVIKMSLNFSCPVVGHVPVPATYGDLSELWERWVSGWMDARVGEFIDGWMGGWMD